MSCSNPRFNDPDEYSVGYCSHCHTPICEDGDAVKQCFHSAVVCEVCGWAPCDGGCKKQPPTVAQQMLGITEGYRENLYSDILSKIEARAEEGGRSLFYEVNIDYLVVDGKDVAAFPYLSNRLESDGFKTEVHNEFIRINW